MKRDLTDKDRLIEQKNREIVKLRLENDEYKSNFEQNESLQVSSNQRCKILNDLNSAVTSLQGELERTKFNLFKDGDDRPPMNQGEQYYQSVTCEEKMIQYLRDEIQQLSQLVSLSSEVFLLSNKFKYSKQGQETMKTYTEYDYKNVL